MARHHRGHQAGILRPQAAPARQQVQAATAAAPEAIAAHQAPVLLQEAVHTAALQEAVHTAALQGAAQAVHIVAVPVQADHHTVAAVVPAVAARTLVAVDADNFKSIVL